MTTLEQLEAKLGTTLHFLRDTLDLQIRQGDKNVIAALQDITEVWEDLSLLMNAERMAAIQKLESNGNSVVDSLMDYAIESFPRSACAKRRKKETTQC